MHMLRKKQGGDGIGLGVGSNNVPCDVQQMHLLRKKQGGDGVGLGVGSNNVSCDV